jgi:hypothetical protein
VEAPAAFPTHTAVSFAGNYKLRQLARLEFLAVHHHYDTGRPKGRLALLDKRLELQT